MSSWFFKDQEVKKYYNIEDTIGAGNFAEVKKCSHKQTGEIFAVKVIEKRRVDPKRRDKILESECAALRRLQHPVQLDAGAEQLVVPTAVRITAVLARLADAEVSERALAALHGPRRRR